MSTTDTLAVPAPRDPRLCDGHGVPQEPTVCPGAAGSDTDEPLEQTGEARLVAKWSADDRPTATWSPEPRPSLVLQRRLVSTLIG